LLLLGTIMSPVARPAPAASQLSVQIGDTQVRPKPYPAPALPPAGGRYVDPTFGTTIIRVTDENDGLGATTMYSYWPSFNRDTTLFFISVVVRASWGKDWVPYLYSFDPSTATFTKRGRLWGNLPLLAEGAIWSGRDRETLFGLNGLRLYQFNVVQKSYVLLKDFAGAYPGATSAWQMSKSTDDRFFAFTLKSPTYADIGVLVWDRQLDRTYTRGIPDPGAYDESHLDRTGRYLFIVAKDTAVWDYAAGAIRSMTRIGHYDVDDGRVVSGCTVSTGTPRFCIFDVTANPITETEVFVRPQNNWDTERHISWLANDRTTFFMSHYVPRRIPPERWKAHMDEITQHWTDGTWRRLAHHRSEVWNHGGNTYSPSPRGNIDPSGRYFIYTSNWDGSRNPDGSPRTDVFILVVPPGRPTPPGSASSRETPTRGPAGR